MKLATIAVMLAVFPLTGAAAEVRARYQMGTVCEITADKPEQIEAAFAEAARIERMLSTWTEESELSRVNRGEIEPSLELRTLLDRTVRWTERTNRAFDARIRHLIVTKDSGRAAGGGFEEGAFGKGYALDRMLPLIAGDALINFGGQILVRGAHGVSVADPNDRDRPVLTFTLADASLSTSAGGHILDPRTGASLPGRGSVSVIAGDALSADILSTALYVMGHDEGLRWAAANGVAAIFINQAKQIRLSPAARSLDVAVTSRDFSIKE